MSASLGGRNCAAVLTTSEGRTVGGVSDSMSLLVMSVKLPSKSKVGLCRRLRGGKGVPTVFLATGSSRGSVLGTFSAKTSSCIIGPFSVGMLLGHVRIILGEGSGRGAFVYKRIVLCSSGGRIFIKTARVFLAIGRCRLLRCLVVGRGRILAGRVVVRGV